MKRSLTIAVLAASVMTVGAIALTAVPAISKSSVKVPATCDWIVVENVPVTDDMIRACFKHILLMNAQSTRVVVGMDGSSGSNGPKGAKGDQGIPGQDGIDGVDGQDGQDGATGPQGPAGQDGEDGADGHDDNGHGNDDDHDDDSNPGQGGPHH